MAQVRSLTLGIGMVVCLLMGTAIGAQTADTQMIAPIQKFVDTFNKGDMAGAAATHAADADLVIIDEVAPYVWRGAGAFQAWVAALGDDSQKQGITDQVVKISAPSRVESAGDQAYVIVPAVYTFKQRGVAMREAAQMTFTLKKGPAGWLIHAWTWTGPKASAAAK